MFFGGNCKIGLYLGVISMYFRIFTKVREQNVNIFEGVNI